MGSIWLDMGPYLVRINPIPSTKLFRLFLTYFIYMLDLKVNKKQSKCWVKKIEARGFPLRVILSLGAMGWGSGQIQKLFIRNRRRLWLILDDSMIDMTNIRWFYDRYDQYKMIVRWFAIKISLICMIWDENIIFGRFWIRIAIFVWRHFIKYTGRFFLWSLKASLKVLLRLILHMSQPPPCPAASCDSATEGLAIAHALHCCPCPPFAPIWNG